MPLRVVFVVVLCTSLARGAKYTIEKSAFRVIEPESLYGVYESAIGDFGVPLYGA